jgi:hypothetical protein
MTPKLFIAMWGVFLSLGSMPCVGYADGTSVLPAEVKAVQSYLLNTEYPEVFKDTDYRMRIDNVNVIDLFNDGYKEVFLQVRPHYLQSPTILIFRVAKDGQVTRVTEGLAPGPLRKQDGTFLDSHALGEAVDLTVGKSNQVDDVPNMVQESLKNFGNVVRYKKFFHMDARKGKGTYIDMSDAKEFPDQDKCREFQFSKVDDTQAGLDSKSHKLYFLAKVGSRIYAYCITKISAAGLLEKTVSTIRVPIDFKQFANSADGSLGYLSKSGGTRRLAVP